jgi:hypothetical protein
MKAKLTFDLNDIDEKIEHLRCVKSLDMALALWHISSNLKKECYRAIENNPKEDPTEYVDLIFEKIYGILEEHSINIDDLVI